jgi:2-polyprenyl-3-methyl-5-hydroxy-6-metoxy-1,4-benzoquinol methylase
MINFENSLKNKMESLKSFISPNYKTALDLGCGTGTDSITLFKIGFSVDAVDHSEGMLETATQNAAKHQSKINFIHSGLGELNLENKSYDFIVSLGNTIANIDNDELNKLLANLNEHLNESGTILIQLINYAKLPMNGEYILNKFKNENISIIRKYDIHSRFINFIIHKTDNSTDKETEIVTKLFPHSVNYFKSYAKENGFKIKLYGSLKKELFIEDTSKNLVIVLSK